tara:strand:+ start:909 stop:1838 length:930 start_codon:yes stop_codon:yes gene_type:complete
MKPLMNRKVKKKIAILLCTKNGEDYLTEQLDSILKQKNFKINIFVSDDNSTDATIKILKNSKYRKFIKKIFYNNFNSASKNFHFLLNNVSTKYDFYSFCDQDDIWKSNKIKRAVQKLSLEFELYGSRTCLVNKLGKKTKLSLKFNKKPSFKNALVQNIAGGNTMVFSKKLFKFIKKIKITNSPAHDWTTYIIATFKGYKVFYDQIPHIYYRQHEKNAIGSNIGLLKTISRILLTFRGKFKFWNKSNIKILNKIKIQGTLENINLLNSFINYRSNYFLLLKDIIIFKFPFYRQTKKGNIMLIIAALLKLI